MLKEAAIHLIEHGWLPDQATRAAIRYLLRRRLKALNVHSTDGRPSYMSLFVEAMKSSPIAVASDQANQQHYEVPAEFYELVLGPRLKYSSALWNDECGSLADAEEAMLELYCERAQIEDGMNILELGCGWGSLTLWLASRFPHARITALSNSFSQRDFILSRAETMMLENVSIVTCNIEDFDTNEKFDRIVSIEMFEHLRNWERLFEAISSWLRSDGRLFFHIFSHRSMPYFFETHGEADWMAAHFFSGGMMPADGLPLLFQSHLVCERTWSISGMNYAKTAAAWLANLDADIQAASAIMAARFGGCNAPVMINRWRIFFMACEELFAYRGGEEWHVAHYLFGKRASR